MIALSLTFIFLVLIIMIILANRYYGVHDHGFDEHEEEVVHTTVTTTTITHQDPAPISTNFGSGNAGTITRGWEDNKPYVFDPVDGEKVFLQETDDLYEDAAGKIWNLV